MHSMPDERNWLSWLVKVRVLILTFLLAIELAVMGLLGLVVLLMVVRPLVRRIITPDEVHKVISDAAIRSFTGRS